MATSPQNNGVGRDIRTLSRRQLALGTAATGLGFGCHRQARPPARLVLPRPTSPSAEAEPPRPSPIIELHLDDFALGDDHMEQWVRRRAEAVAAFLGGFPVDRVDLRLNARWGSRVGFGHVYIQGGEANLRINIGRHITANKLDADWVLVHELLHFAIPMLADEHRWLDEGTATYLEPLIRARMGNVDERYVWDQFIWGMEKGRPRPGDRGLDATPTWGRTYWGGALFSLVADVRICAETKGKHSLQDAWRAIARESGGRVVHWPLERVLSTGDQATGTEVLSKLHRDWAHTPRDVDLDALWAEMGVIRDGDDLVALDDEAPQAWIRQALTRPTMQRVERPPIIERTA